jgi:hypothetical protein
MVKVKFGQLDNLEAVLDSWWQVTGLPVAFQRQLLGIRRSLADQRGLFEELRKKFIDEYAAKNADGQYVLTDPEVANAHWRDLWATDFECAAINIDDLEKHAEKLGMTLEKLTIIDVLLSD